MSSKKPLQELASILAAGYLRFQAKISAERNETVDKPDLQLADPLYPLAISATRSDVSNQLVDSITASLRGGYRV